MRRLPPTIEQLMRIMLVKKEQLRKTQIKRMPWKKLKATFQIAEIDNMSDHLRNIRIDRERVVVAQTLDNIGVTSIFNTKNQSHVNLLQAALGNSQQLNDLLRESSAESKLALIRNLQFLKHIPNDKRLQQLCKDLLEELGMHDEMIHLTEMI
ncbi:hypothetical protein EHS13_10740 [Paenibacillus psychroresistens]|uniref:Uncharacterized protein n=1 Tax=Paenibacillus psychroresistens TaxID=1778678 RepID=A0A6B8RI99_9BACL|nr:hypothetical protein [Paenibacillus psychroresistens]QGQ95325.1 hypothetical protein EHS13_10740 [Paenibacillus psychroresistens]